MKHLTQGARYHISALLQNRHTQAEIAAELGVHPSTISRELERNTTAAGEYDPERAQELAGARRSLASSGGRVSDAIIMPQLQKIIEDGWTPEQAAGWTKRHGVVSASVQTLYNRLHELLPRAARQAVVKRYRRRGAQETRGRIPCRTGIAERPPIVAARARRGDYESDLMMGKQGKQAISVTIDRKSRHVSLYLMRDRSAAEKNRAVQKAMRKAPVTPRALTPDNGKETSDPAGIRRRAGLRCCFADPYASWQRGSVENAIGVLRRHIPKGADLSSITARQLNAIQRWFNNSILSASPAKPLTRCIMPLNLIAFHFRIRTDINQKLANRLKPGGNQRRRHRGADSACRRRLSPPYFRAPP